MSALSKRRDDEDELSPLPPLDGEEDARDDAPIEGVDLEEAKETLDDTEMEALDTLDDFGEDLEGADDEPALDLPVGDDEVVAESERGGDEGEAATGEDADLDLNESLGDRDRGEEGPAGDQDDTLDALPPLDDDPSLDEGAEGHEGLDPLAHNDDELLAELDSTRSRRLRGAAVAMGAARGIARLLVVGDGVSSIALDALDDPDLELGAVDAPGDHLFVSVAEGDAGLFLGTIEGVVLRKRRAERQWTRVMEPRGPRLRAPVELHTEGRRVWCLVRGSRLLRSTDAGRFEALGLLDGARAMALDPHGGVLVATAKRTHGALWSSPDGETWTEITLPESAVLRAVAGCGDTLLGLAGASAPGMVSVDGGRHWTRWRCLLGATAATLVETDDGLIQVLFALYDDLRDRAVLAVAGVSAQAEPVGARRLAVIDHGVLPGGGADADADPECKVDCIVPLDRAGRQIAVATARGVVLVERGD